MADYAALTKKLVADAIIKKIPGLNRKADFKFFVSAGTYDAAADAMTNEVWNTVADVVCVEVKPTFADVTNLNVVAASKKLLVPGVSLPKEPETDTDRVMLDGEEWTVKKTIGVPGGSLYIVFVART